MKKVININFHSRVIPIEETAYDILRRYVESLKKHFAGEEGGDEIVNDIEDRFAELFSDRLKKGSVCITDADVEEIIASMGHPEDFDQDEKTGFSAAGPAIAEPETKSSSEPRRLYRSDNDKMLGGICGGFAAYFNVDSAFVRIIYALIILGSFGTALLIYFVLWIVLPQKSTQSKIRKRLFRDADHKVIGGVASGLASYFQIDVWIPRVIFCLPIILGVLTSIFRHAWFDFDGPVFFTNGFGGTLLTTYIILWIVLPEALTAPEKLEMRGEKIDLESIKNTIKNDLKGFRERASVVGAEIKVKAEEFGNEMKDKSGGIRRDISSARIPRQGIGHAIGVLFKAFFLFIAVIISFALITALIGLIFSGAGVLPLKNYFILGFLQNIMGWAVLILFLILPVVALLTWLIRRIIGVRARRNYLGYVFGTLWTIGLICLVFLAASVSRHFSNRSGVSEEIPMTAPGNGKLIVKMDQSRLRYFDADVLGMDWQHAPFTDITDDSLILNTVRINIVKSKDSVWHLHRDKMSRGNTNNEARVLASQIKFNVEQKDSFLLLAPGFAITPSQQFRNQQVLVIIEMPVGKKILLQTSVDGYRWFNVNSRRWPESGFSVDGNNSNDFEEWNSNVEYIMTEDGLQRTHRLIDSDKEDDDENNPGNSSDSTNQDNDRSNKDYRYHKTKDVTATPAKATAPFETAECRRTLFVVPSLALFTTRG